MCRSKIPRVFSISCALRFFSNPFSWDLASTTARYFVEAPNKIGLALLSRLITILRKVLRAYHSVRNVYSGRMLRRLLELGSFKGAYTLTSRQIHAVCMRMQHKVRINLDRQALPPLTFTYLAVGSLAIETVRFFTSFQAPPSILACLGKPLFRKIQSTVWFCWIGT